eukprot:scaffold4577_cov135-Isochrysis_galbana.AAC.2
MTIGWIARRIYDPNYGGVPHGHAHGGEGPSAPQGSRKNCNCKISRMFRRVQGAGCRVVLRGPEDPAPCAGFCTLRRTLRRTCAG